MLLSQIPNNTSLKFGAVLDPEADHVGILVIEAPAFGMRVQNMREVLGMTDAQRCVSPLAVFASFGMSDDIYAGRLRQGFAKRTGEELILLSAVA